MKIGRLCKKKENTILALAVTVLAAVFVGVAFDYYYQANDDIYIKNILAGVYTGTPESRNIQMHYPISLLLSLIYRIAGGLSVYGLFLCACHYGCLFLLVKRSLECCKQTAVKVGLAVTAGVLFQGLLLWELVFTQYTVTATLLAATAAFRFYTTDKNLETKAFIRANISNILLVILAFLVRSEMLLLVLPLICVAGLCKWTTQKPVFTKPHAVKYLSVAGGILAGLVLAQGIHMLAYSSGEWRAFQEFFDNRTELYDYQNIPLYEGNETFYESIGLTRGEAELLRNYNFGLDEEINSQVLLKTAEYFESMKKEGRTFSQSFHDGFLEYRYRLLHEVDYPWNMAVLAAYGFLVLFALKNRQYAYFWKIPLLGGVRTVLWMYIMMGGRSPERITHSLYLMELCILLAMILEQCSLEPERSRNRNERYPQWMQIWMKHSLTICAGVLLLALGLAVLPYEMQQVQAESSRRDYANQEYNALKDYCAANPENFYFVDVYSAVSCTDYAVSDLAVEYSEKLFEDVNNSLANYDIMGGWLSKSPLTEKKFEQFGINTMEKAVLDMENVYVIIKKEESTDWLTEYYREKGCGEVSVSSVDSIWVDQKPVYEVYSIE